MPVLQTQVITSPSCRLRLNLGPPLKACAGYLDTMGMACSSVNGGAVVMTVQWESL